MLKILSGGGRPPEPPLLMSRTESALQKKWGTPLGPGTKWDHPYVAHGKCAPKKNGAPPWDQGQNVTTIIDSSILSRAQSALHGDI